MKNIAESNEKKFLSKILVFKYFIA